MAYTDDAVLSKLSALNESHDSIATTAQWIMFHRRHASQTVHLWLTKLKDLPSHKRLNMIYLANEVTQQSKARHKDDFLNAFSPYIADATALAYKGAPPDIQAKLRRVLDVWKERCIFDRDILQDIEAKFAEIDRSRPQAPFGGGFSSSAPSIPSELQPLVAPQLAVTKSLQPAKTAVTNANAEYDKLSDPTANATTPLPVQAARLNGLLKTLANAEGAVTECIRARRDLIRELEKILATTRDALATDEKKMMELSARRTEVEQRKQAIERAIVAGASGNGNGASVPAEGAPATLPVPEPDRPQVEALTPPHIQDHSGDLQSTNQPPAAVPFHVGPAPTSIPSASQTTAAPNPFLSAGAPGIEMLSNLASQYSSVPVMNNGVGTANKKRKIGDATANDDFPDLGNDDGIDAEVREMLRSESQGQGS